MNERVDRATPERGTGPPANGLTARLTWSASDFSLDARLHIEPGQTLALVGPNGAGKSTIVRLLAGLTPLTGDDTAAIHLDGTTLDDPAAGVFVPPERRRVAVVFQDHLLFDHLDVRDNVAFGLRAQGDDRRTAGRRADELLDSLGLDHLAATRPPALSGGQAQRVAIARALAVKPSLLLLDEPMAALDVETRVEVRRFLAEHLRALEPPALLISHDPTDALALADRIAVLESGRISQEGTPDDVRRRPATRYAASLAGTNLVEGIAADADVTVTHSADGAADARTDGTDIGAGRPAGHRLRIADAALRGPVRCAIRPESVSIHVERPSGSQRNVWPTTVDLVEPVGDTTRVTVGAPLPLAIDVTTSAADALGLRSGLDVWVAVKATEIAVTPA